MNSRILVSAVSLYVLLMLINTGHSLRINHGYLARMVDELSSLCPYTNSCKPKSPHTDADYTYVPLDSPTVDTLWTSSCCTWCYCDDGCLAEHRCCPEVMLQRYSDGEFVPEMTYQCRMKHFKLPTDSRYTFVVYGSFMTDTCLQPPEAIGYNESVDMKCREPDIRNIDEMLPVTSNATGEFYINKYCAVCSGDDTASPWLPYIGLTDGKRPLDIMTNYVDKSWEELYTLSYTPNSDLNMYLERPFPEDNRKTCVAPVIYHCNATGLWETYDPFYEFACMVYRSIYFHQDDSGDVTAVFANVSCAVCNGMTSNVSKCSLPAVYDLTLPVYMSLLNYQQTDRSDVTQGSHGDGDGICPHTDFLDPLQNICRPWNCPKGSHYNGDRCIATLSGFMGAPLLFITKVGPIHVSIHLSETEARQLAPTLISSIFSKDAAWPGNGLHIEAYQIHAYTSEMANVTQKYLVFLLKSPTVTNVTQSQANIEAFLGAMATQQNASTLFNGPMSMITATFANNIVIHESSYNHNNVIKLLDIDNGTMADIVYDGYSRVGVAGMWRVSNLDVCTSFVLHEDEYMQNEHFIALSDVDVSFYSTQYDATGLDNGVRLCVDDYIDAVSKCSANSGHGLSFNVRYVLVLIIVHCVSNVARA